MSKIDIWIKKHQKKHFCKCGCGKIIKIRRWHHYTGIPKFIHNHRIRVSCRIKTKCAWCGKSVEVIKYYYEKLKHHFCDKDCYYKFKIGKPFHRVLWTKKLRNKMKKLKYGGDKCKVCGRKRDNKLHGIILCHEHFLAHTLLRKFLLAKGFSSKNIPNDFIIAKAEFSNKKGVLNGYKESFTGNKISCD
jgi:hypothetical protein